MEVYQHYLEYFSLEGSMEKIITEAVEEEYLNSVLFW